MYKFILLLLLVLLISCVQVQWRQTIDGQSYYGTECFNFGQCMRVMRTICDKEYKILSHHSKGWKYQVEFKCTEKVEL